MPFYYFFILLFQYYIICEKILEIKYQVIFNIPRTVISFIDEEFAISTYINTYLPYSLLDDTTIKNHKLSRYESKNISLEHTIESFLMKEKINFGTYPISNYMFYYSDFIRFIPDYGIGLGYKFENDSFSLVHLLYNTSQIDKKLFAFQSFNDSTEMDEKRFFVGGITNNAHLKSKYKGYCDVEDNYKTWGCNLTKISYNNTNYEVNIYSIFHSSFGDFICSNFFFNLMTDTIFKERIEQKTCRVSINNNNEKVVYCTDYLDNGNSTIELEFGKMTISFKINELFKKASLKEWKSLFISNPYSEYGESIILGSLFLRAFQFSVFDYENKQVQLYSNTINIIMNSGINNYSKIILILITVMTFVISIYLFFLHLNKHCNN